MVDDCEVSLRSEYGSADTPSRRSAYGLGMLWFFLTQEPLGIQLRTRLFGKASAPGA